MSKKKYNFIDLFAGCGGLSEGFMQTGCFDAVAHVEIDKSCCNTLRNRMEYYGYDIFNADRSVLELDITRDDINGCIDVVNEGRCVDVIIGGPPCQAYSTAGRARDEKGMKNDPRNYLFENYVKVLNHFNPKIFVFENVTGILTASINGKKIINSVFEKLSETYDVCTDLGQLVFNTADYGVPQVRKRVIIIGVRKDLNLKAKDVYSSISKTHCDPEDSIDDHGNLKAYVTVRDAIGDLPKLEQSDRRAVIPFTSSSSNHFIKYIREVGETELYDHISRTHNELDTQRYIEMSKNIWTFEQMLEHRPDLGHPKKRVFNNSYAVQFWNKPARTIIAHLHKDGNQFIHPEYTQGRTLSVREAARLQSFPDNFRFAGSQTQQYKQIGNAVPPLFANVIAKSVIKIFTKLEK